MRELGKTQKSILKSLQTNGSWYRGCGWIWGNDSETERLLDSLVRRGLAKVDTVHFDDVLGKRERVRYTLIENPDVMTWAFDEVHNHWRSGRYLIWVQFNETGTRHLFYANHYGGSHGAYDLERVPDLLVVAGCIRLQIAKETCERYEQNRKLKEDKLIA